MSILTTSYFVNQANNFIANIRNTSQSYYVFTGRSYPWPNDSAPPIANTSAAQYQQSIYSDLLFGKLIGASDVINLIPRYNWTANTVYTPYNQNDPNLSSEQFYVVTSTYQVYKCIYNNNGSPSTVQPSLSTPTGTFTTGDGYVWKFMYSIDSTSNTKFTSASYVPAIQDTNVKLNAMSGSIDAVQITNGGLNYQVYETGNIAGVVTPYIIQLPNTSSSVDNYYTNSSIYLKSGFGGGQVRQIIASSGLNKTVTISQTAPLTTYNLLGLSNATGTISVGYTVEQPLDYVSYLYGVGYVNPGAFVVQTDTGISGTIVSANSSILQINKSNEYQSFTLGLPIFDSSQSGTLKSGTLTINSGSTYANAVSGTSLTTDYAIGSYIRIGSNANNNIRRVTAVNTSVVTVDTAFNNTLVANTHYNVPTVYDPVSITSLNAIGYVTNTNLSSLNISIANSSISGSIFTVGETVDLVDSSNIFQNANGTVAFANTTSLYISNVSGSNFSNNSFWANTFFVRGESSSIKYNISAVTSNPNITITQSSGSFITGKNINVKFNGANTASAFLLSQVNIPNSLTSYVISPTVSISGNGSGAIAVSTVNNSVGSANNIQSIQMINAGSGYTTANVSIFANSSYGTNASATAIISPTSGHGYDTLTELGARYVGIDKVFDSGSNESYYFPTYGSYRRIGVIQNPLFANVAVILSNFDRVNLNLTNSVPTNPSWVSGEVVVQASSNAAGIVVSGNSSFLQLKNAKGVFTDSAIYAYSSNTSANVTNSNTVYFGITSTPDIISEVTSGANGSIYQVVSNTSLVLTNVAGQFSANDIMFDATSNAYATVASIVLNNRGQNVTTNFGQKFNNTLRITLTSNSGAFVNNEIVSQAVSNASGFVVATSNELDISLTGMTGANFTTGQTVTDTTTSANAIVTFANSSYVKLTSVISNNFVTGHTLSSGTGSTATISNVFPVLLLNNASGAVNFQYGNNIITGLTSGSTATCNNASLISYPDLVRNSGSVIYMENISPVTRTGTSKEEFKLVVKF